MKTKRKCVVCGKDYEFCPHCRTQDASKPLWYYSFDGEPCHELWGVLSAYSSKLATENDVKNVIDKYNLNYDHYNNKIKEQISSILSKIPKKTIETSDNEPEIPKNTAAKSSRIKTKNKKSDIVE